jgi:hypothetical protein
MSFPSLYVISLGLIAAMSSFFLYRPKVHFFCAIYQQTFGTAGAWEFVSDLLWAF